MMEKPGSNVAMIGTYSNPQRAEFEKKLTEKATQRHDLELDFIKKQLRKDNR